MSEFVKVEPLTCEGIVGKETLARLRDFGGGLLVFIPEQALGYSNAKALRDWLTVALGDAPRNPP